MRMLGTFVAALFMLVLSGCTKPVPPDKAAYVGEWASRNTYLLITPEGRVDYRRKKGSASTSIKADLKEFEGDNFIVGFGPINTTFVVTAPPHQDGTVWKMTVDGDELTRKPSI